MGTVDLSTIKRTELLHQGKANNVWLTTNPDYLELEASDRISAGNGAKTDVISGKGVANNTVSQTIFQLLEEHGIHTHYVGPGSNPASKIVKRATPILLEVIGRFCFTGSFSRRYSVPDMTPADGVFIEYTYKHDNPDDPSASDPPISEAAIMAKGMLTKRELGYVEYVTEQVALVLRDFFVQCNVDLIDFKIEFGRLDNGQIIIIDEISPDTCRLSDRTTGESLDKDRFRQDMGHVAEAYDDMARRVKGLSNK